MFFSCKLLTHSCCLLLNELFWGFLCLLLTSFFHFQAHCNVRWAFKAQRVIFTTPQCLLLTYMKSNKPSTHGKMLSAVWGHWCKYNELLPGRPCVLRQVGLRFLLFKWIVSLFPCTCPSCSTSEKEKTTAWHDPLKRQAQWTIDIPLARHHRSTSHISLCSSDNTMWLDQNSPLLWLCWHALPPITHPSVIPNYTWMRLRYEVLPLIKCTD